MPPMGPGQQKQLIPPMQLPLQQMLLQGLPQEPQLAGLLVRSRQVPPQSVWPAGQPQAPLVQIFPPEQTTPPQVHGPLEQTSLSPHALPQSPQFDGSVLVSTQVPQ
jgi:hypothetical protein